MQKTRKKKKLVLTVNQKDLDCYVIAMNIKESKINYRVDSSLNSISVCCVFVFVVRK